MDETVGIIILTASLAIILFMFYTKRKAGKFEAQHTGVYKTKLIILGLESLFLLAFAAAALLTLKSIIGPVPSIILMAVTFLCWLPFQTLLCTMLSLDDGGMTYMNPLRGTAEIPWQDVKSVSVSRSGILKKSGDETIRIRSFFTDFNEIKDTVKEKCPRAFK